MLAGVLTSILSAGCGGGGGSGGGGSGGGSGSGGGGSGGAPADCRQVQPCGGDVVGTWLLDVICSDGAVTNAELAASCGGNTDRMVAGISATLSWMITFNADMTYTSGTLMETFHSTQIIPLGCTTLGSCADVAASYTGLTSAATCTGTTTCTCDYSGTLTLAAASGTWAPSGTTLLGMDSDAPAPYCVEGNRLHLMTYAPTAKGPMGEPLIIGDLVGQKQ